MILTKNKPDNLPFISSLYQSEKAIREYYSILDTHKQGLPYKNVLENMYYLNDDFNDKLYHFSAAVERYNINCGIIKDRIKKMKERSKNTLLYKQESYIKEIWYDKYVKKQ